MKVELYDLNTKIGEYEFTGVAFEKDGVVVGTCYRPAFAAVLFSHGVYSTAKLVIGPDE